MENIDEYLNGSSLYGDKLAESEIAEWYADEKDGYADLGAKNSGSYAYGYHALNSYHAFRHMANRRFRHALGFGSAYGDEFLPLRHRVDELTVVDPSDAFVRDDVHGIPAKYVKPDASGRLPFAGGTFDLITCLGVLHHIPNVSFVVKELARVLESGGHLALNEPIVSMGDWRLPRPGLTKRERGIPLHILREIISRSGMRVIREGLCSFPVTHRLFNAFRSGKNGIYNNPGIARFDAYVCKSFGWNVNYHPRTLFRRFCPGSVFYLLQKS